MCSLLLIRLRLCEDMTAGASRSDALMGRIESKRIACRCDRLLSMLEKQDGEER